MSPLSIHPDLDSGGGFAGAACHVYRSTNQTGILDGTAALLLYNAEADDVLDMHSLVSDTGRITPTVSGKYVFTCQIAFSSGNLTGSRQIHLCKNSAGAIINRVARTTVGTSGLNAGDSLGMFCSTPPISMNGTTDYIESFVIADIVSGSVPEILGGQDLTWFTCHKVSD